MLGRQAEARTGGHARRRRETQSLAELARAQVGADGEVALVAVLESRGYRLVGQPGPIGVNGEVDVAAQVDDQSGSRLWAVHEAKARLHRADVRQWARSLQDSGFRSRLAASGVVGPLLPFAFRLRVYPEADEAGQATGIGIIGPRGLRVEPGAALP